MFCLSQFFASAAGSQLRRWEANQLDILLKGLHGEAALQIGVPYGPVMRSAPHRFKVVSTVTSEIKIFVRVVHYCVSLLQIFHFEMTLLI